MAEGGEFGYNDLELGNKLDQKDDDDKQEVNTPHPFQLGAVSTPYHGGEEIKCKRGITSRPRCLTLLMTKSLCLATSWIKTKNRLSLKRPKTQSEESPRGWTLKKMYPINLGKKGSGIYFLEEVSGVKKTFFETSFKISWQESQSELSSVQLPAELWEKISRILAQNLAPCFPGWMPLTN